MKKYPEPSKDLLIGTQKRERFFMYFVRFQAGVLLLLFNPGRPGIVSYLTTRVKSPSKVFWVIAYYGCFLWGIFILGFWWAIFVPIVGASICGIIYSKKKEMENSSKITWWTVFNGLKRELEENLISEISCLFKRKRGNAHEEDARIDPDPCHENHIVNEWWARRFKIFDERNGKFAFTWNWPAFFFTIFWYFLKGMWKKGLTYICIGLLLDYIFGGPCFWDTPFVHFFIISCFYGVIASYDYYRYTLRNEIFWWREKENINYFRDRLIGAILCVVFLLLLVLLIY